MLCCAFYVNLKIIPSHWHAKISGDIQRQKVFCCHGNNIMSWRNYVGFFSLFIIDRIWKILHISVCARCTLRQFKKSYQAVNNKMTVLLERLVIAPCNTPVSFYHIKKEVHVFFWPPVLTSKSHLLHTFLTHTFSLYESILMLYF